MESSRKLSEIKSLHDKIRVSTEETKKKEEIYKQLVMDPFYTFLLKARCIVADLFFFFFNHSYANSFLLGM